MTVVSDTTGEGRFIEKTTASTTVRIPAGRIVEYDTSGDIVLPTTTPVVDLMAGVSVTDVAARTSATKKKIVVQVSGLAHIACAANSAFTAGYYVREATAGSTPGYASTAALATTITSTALAACIGKVVIPDATTTGTTIVVSLKNL